MSLSIELMQGRSGRRIARVTATGQVTDSEAASFNVNVQAGGGLSRVPLLFITDATTHLPADTRRALGQRVRGPSGAKKAVVAVTPLLRVTFEFINRLLGDEQLKLFDNEEQALQWLELTQPGKAA